MQRVLSEKLIPILLLVIITCFGVAFLPAFQTLLDKWAGGDNSYCYLIVPLFLYLLYDKKDRFSFADFSWSPWGLVPVVGSVMLILVGELGSVRALMFMGIWGCLVGLCIVLYGKRTWHLAFPLLILFFIVP
ncbi:MAG: hypothetical protein GY849_18845, partial [Deltaproteobacteria bacterium]|nr:hypothetical protein [Deltaproteobacteria bacterium]